MLEFPQTFRLRQAFERHQIEDVPSLVQTQLEQLALGERIGSGETVAITAGSRGIANISQILSAVVEHVRLLGAKPIVVAAMGAHGGGTSEGQRRILECYGITEQVCGCPVVCNTETVVVCQAEQGFPILCDRTAYEADHILVVNRVRPHTRFAGYWQSGLMKMLLIGLGKQEGAKIYHRAFEDFDFDVIATSVAETVIRQCNVAGGLAILENGYFETAEVVAVAAEEIPICEQDLLQQAIQWMPRLPFPSADLLLVDEIGKEISGTGLDTNVVGRKTPGYVASHNVFPYIKRILVRNLTETSHGNANGLGIAEFCTARCVGARDEQLTLVNSLTANNVVAGKLPAHFETDREMLATALTTIGLTTPQDARMMWIRNTRDLDELECSAAYYDEADSRDDVEILCEPRPLLFDGDGNLPQRLSETEM